jgi:hypothetical protein
MIVFGVRRTGLQQMTVESREHRVEVGKQSEAE